MLELKSVVWSAQENFELYVIVGLNHLSLSIENVLLNCSLIFVTSPGSKFLIASKRASGLFLIEIKSLLISQIEKRVRWLESVEYMVNSGVKNFVEIGPGKVLSGLIKRINKNVTVNSINSDEDIKLLIND